MLDGPTSRLPAGSRLTELHVRRGVEAVRVSDAAPPELAVAKATPDGATEKML